MSTIDVTFDMSGLEAKLNRLERQQLPFARSLAANQAAFTTMQTMRKAAGLYIDEPTPFTVGGIRYRRGTKKSPVAEVYLSGDAAKGTAPAKYLTITRGGRRGQRRSERVLTRAGIIGPDEGWIPAKALKLNRFGNVPASRIVQILSQVRAFGEEGFQANVTARSRRTAKGRRRQQYFLSRGDHLPRGIYERYGPKRRKVRPVLLFIPLPTYGKDFDFRGLAADEARRRFLEAWPAALRRALATARR